MNQIIFFNKSACDYSNQDVSVSITDSVATNTGETFAHYMFNRNNNSAWITTGSSDAGTTTLEIDFGQERYITDLLLVLNNLKAFTIQYDDSGWTDFSTPINESTNTETTKRFSFTRVLVQKIKIIITGTMVADADKIIRQLIVSDIAGQLNSYPQIKKPTHSTNKKNVKMLSGKYAVIESVGAFSVTLSVSLLSDSEDANLVEDLYESRSAYLVWLCGGNESQFKNLLKGYRKEDIYLVRPSDEYQNEFYTNYTTGTKFNMKLNEVVN